MIDLNLVKSCFSNLTSITPLSQSSGQREVCHAYLDGKKVALKIFIMSPKAEERMQREIHAIAKLGSPFVPKILAYGKKLIGDSDRLYIIEEWCEGQLLSDSLRLKRYSFVEALEFCKFLLQACLDFESKELVHRDIKPNNLMMKSLKEFYVLDFGIVRHLDLVSLTETAHAFGLGTLGYSAPEQMRNIKVKINSRADLYSIGIVIYEMLAGHNPYLVNAQGNPLILLNLMEKQNLPKLMVPEDQDSSFSDFLSALVERFPSRRPQTAKDALEWFNKIYDKYVTTSESQ